MRGFREGPVTHKSSYASLEQLFRQNDLSAKLRYFSVPRQRLYRPRSNSVGAGGVHAASGLFAKQEREPLAHKPGLLRSAVIEAADQRRAAGIFEPHVRVG